MLDNPREKFSFNQRLMNAGVSGSRKRHFYQTFFHSRVLKIFYYEGLLARGRARKITVSRHKIPVQKAGIATEKPCADRPSKHKYHSEQVAMHVSRK